jgi:hypothetical protein
VVTRARITLLCIALALVCAVTGWAESTDEPTRSFKIGGLLFGDAYHIASHHTEEGEGATGLVLRRGYLTFDAVFSEALFGRLRFEVNQSGEFETYDFEVDFKDLFLGWHVGRHELKFGLSPTPTFDLIESIWGLRSLARTPMDLQGVASRDTGVSGTGPLNRSGSWSYRAMVGAGTEFGTETGDGRKWMLAVNWEFLPDLMLDLYADYEVLPGPTDRRTLQAFIGSNADRLRWGLMYSDQDRQDDPPLKLASAFVIRPINDVVSLIGRVDRLLEPSVQGDNIAYIPFDPTARATFFIGGVEIRVKPRFWFTPNIIYTTYDENDDGVRPRSDIHLRVTLFANFE